ncbi:MAG: hypothetical protein ACYCX7_04145, partial [Solirubrobacteraceae bacterium]
MGLRLVALPGAAARRLRGGGARRRAALGVHFVLAAGAVGALATELVASRTPNVALLAALAAAGVLAEVREVRLVNGIGVDASVAVALIALVAWGPLPAFGLLVLSIAGGSIATGAALSGAGLRA